MAAIELSNVRIFVTCPINLSMAEIKGTNDSADYIIKHGTLTSHLQISLRETELVGQVISLIGEARTKLGKNIDILTDDKSDQTRIVQYLVESVFEATKDFGQNELMRTNFYSSHRPALLGEIFKSKGVMCRERAIMLHVVLAEWGIPSLIVLGKNGDTAHAWIGIEGKAGNKELIDKRWFLDPSYCAITYGHDFENYPPYKVTGCFSLVRPKTLNICFGGSAKPSGAPSMFDD